MTLLTLRFNFVYARRYSFQSFSLANGRAYMEQYQFNPIRKCNTNATYTSLESAKHVCFAEGKLKWKNEQRSFVDCLLAV